MSPSFFLHSEKFYGILRDFYENATELKVDELVKAEV